MTNVINKIKDLKDRSGTHSPSIDTLIDVCPELSIEVDACFLSNPYATELFMNSVKEDLIEKNKLRDILEFYPPQNHEIARNISKAININANKIFVGNGAIEIIQAILHNYVEQKICVIIPTFSSYYEFIKPNVEIIYFELEKTLDFQLNVEKYIEFIKKHNPDTIIIINPNNPNGGYLNKEELNYVLDNTKNIRNVIIDESFIHFAYEDSALSQISSEELVDNYDNLIIVKSMSKDFGIAGLRAGYAVMNSQRVSNILKNGYLWNVSGLANYFFKVYSNQDFMFNYDIARKKYIMNTKMFLSELEKLNGIRVYPSKANFALIEIKNGMSSFEFFAELLVRDGIYVRDCSDKLGLNGEFVRIASRTFEENLKIINAVKKLL